jgi:hypothetical protein
MRTIFSYILVAFLACVIPSIAIAGDTGTCVTIGRVSSFDALSVLYRKHGTPIVLMEDIAYYCDCGSRKLGGDTEGRKLGGDTDILRCEIVPSCRLFVIKGITRPVNFFDGYKITPSLPGNCVE